MEVHRERIRVNGIVQGVGFRPFVYKLALDLGLAGFARNRSDGVLIEVEGNLKKVTLFRMRVINERPPLARIVEITSDPIPPTGETGFVIKESDSAVEHHTLISPDVALCTDCLNELNNPKDRRYRYPFINCTNCGPRFTIVANIPYDRANTSMSEFPLCDQCSQEYWSVESRRFHAQPNACWECGPEYVLTDSEGNVIAGKAPLRGAVDKLKEGRILCVKGIGGFHLAVDATNDPAVMELRRRKGREEKPLALMAPDLSKIREFCYLSEDEESELVSPAHPIVLLVAREQHSAAPSVAPGNDRLGFMLPYTPAHHLLLRDNFDALVMTSANFSEEPIAIENTDALERLGGVADFFLFHNREILQRCDDSVMYVAGGRTRFIRRSRGFVPEPIVLASPTHRSILAVGGELKNTIALSRSENVFLSQHIGDLENPQSLEFFEESVAHLLKVLEIDVEAIVHDLHPQYLSTKWARAQGELPTIGIQHHHAHLASVMAENGIFGPTLGIILDGTGFGLDGTIWGGELLLGDTGRFERLAWLKPFGLPGGEAAIRQPWRTALSVLYSTFGDDFTKRNLPLFDTLSNERISTIKTMLDRNLNTPRTSSAGRLFDSISSILGVRQEVTYEAQAAIDLEQSVDPSEHTIYEKALISSQATGPLSWFELIRCIVKDFEAGVDTRKIAARFHWTLAEIFVAQSLAARDRTRVNRIGLSGGVYQNIQLLSYMMKRLDEEGFQLLTHSQVPTNDGGLSLGQVVIADTILNGKGPEKPALEN